MKNVSILMLSSILFACREPGKVNSGQGSIDTETVTSTNSEEGTETTSETSTETSTNTDTQTDSDTDTETTTETNSDTDTETGTETSEEVIDNDGDGFAAEDDCDDNNPQINPEAQEICDELDNDCDTLIDADDSSVLLTTWYIDGDGDGYGDESYTGYEICTPPPGFVDNNTDCDDLDPFTNIGGSANELDPTQCMTDVDGDGYGDPNPSSTNAVAGTDCDDNDANNVPTDSDADGYSGCSGDCDDTNANVNPGLDEQFFDGLDNDCDGIVDQINAAQYDAAVFGAAEDYLSFDNSISAADVTGDGIPEVFVGSALVGNAVDSNADGYTDFQGAVYMLNGANYSTWDGDVSGYAAATIYGDSYLNYFSTMTPTQSDIDGDGKIDLAIGGTDAGSIYGFSDVASTIFYDAASLSGDYYGSDADILMSDTTSNFGASRINSNLDLNGDGYNEFIASDFITGYFFEGTWFNNDIMFWASCLYGGCDSTVYLYNGANLQSGDYSLELDASNVWHDETDYDFFGQTIAGGDIDGDGKDELIVAAPGHDENAPNAGCLFLYRGSDEIVDDENYIWDPADADFYFDSDNASICGETTDAYLGWNNGVQLGDVNGDGDIDLVAAAPVSNQIFIFYSVSSLFGQPHDAETDADVVITADASIGFFGYGLAVGDMNGDGYDDIAVGAPDPTEPIIASFFVTSILHNGTPTNNGMVYLFDGSTLSSSMSESDATGMIVSDEQDMFGMNIVATDINVDGKADLLIGAPLANATQGSASLYIMK